MRHFTVDEANELIPTLTPILEDLQGLQQRLVDVAGEVADFERRAMGNGNGENTDMFKPGHDLREIQREIQQRVHFLQGMGCHLKAIEHGIVDFPTRMYGRDVYLCWRLGEARVAYWHDMDAGFAGRQPL